jgi:hypothetical protein
MKFLARNTLLPVAFLLLCIGSVSYIVISAINYTMFFPALDQVQSHTSISSITLEQDPLSPSGERLDVHAILANPSDYTGLTIASVGVSVYFVHRSTQGNSTLFAFLPLAGTELGGPLGPRSQIPINLLLPLSSENASSLGSFSAQYPGQVAARISLILRVSTFLDSVTGYMPLIIDQELPFS